MGKSSKQGEIFWLAVCTTPWLLFSQLPAKNYVIFVAIAWAISKIKRPAWIDAVLCSFSALFLIVNVHGWSPNFELPYATGTYNSFFGQLRQGKLTLPAEPDERLKVLPNPHSPSARAGVPFPIDYSLYHGKFYLYPGLSPLLLAGAPYFFVTGRYLTDAGYYCFFGIWTLIAGYFLILILMRRLLKSEPTALDRFFASGIMTFCCLLGAMANRVLIVEIAAVCAMALVLTGFFLLASGRYLLLAGLSLGLAVGARPLAGISLLAATFFLQNIRGWRRFIGGFAIPISIIAVYNSARYGRPWEFGYQYVLNHVDFLHYYSLKNFLYGAGAALFQPVFLTQQFPFVRLTNFGEGWLAFRHSWLVEPTAGIFLLCPFVILALSHIRTWFSQRDFYILAAFFFVGVAHLIADSTSGTSLRYSAELIIYVVIASLISLRTIPARYKWGSLVGQSLLLYAMNLGFFVTYSQQFDVFKSKSPRIASGIETFYSFTQAEHLSPNRALYPVEMLIRADHCGFDAGKRRALGPKKGGFEL